MANKAEQCLEEAQKLEYAYFAPELDNFSGEITIEAILFKVLSEVDNLDWGDGGLTKHEVNDSYDEGHLDIRWNANRNKAWRRKAVKFLNQWAAESGETRDIFENIK